MRQPTTENLNLSTTRQQFSQLVNRVYRGETRVLVEKSGLPVAAIVSPNDLEHLRRLDEERAEFSQLLEELRAPFRDIPAEEVEREIAKALAEVRREMRQEREANRVTAKSA